MSKSKPAQPAQPQVKIKCLQKTACETLEGGHVDMKPGEVLTVPARAADYLIRNKRAEPVQ